MKPASTRKQGDIMAEEATNPQTDPLPQQPCVPGGGYCPETPTAFEEAPQQFPAEDDEEIS